MPTLNVNGKSVQVDDSFLGLPPDQQNATVDEIAKGIDQSYANASVGDIAKEAISNVPSSAVDFAKATAQPFIHPIDTAESLGNLAKGYLQKAGIVSGDDSEGAADALTNHFADRYGSVAGFKKAVAQDPVGVLADISTVLTLGGSAAARAPSVIGKAGEIARAAGDLTNPINIATKGAELAGKATAKGLNYASGGGVSYDALVKAAEAGGQGIGSAESNAFWSNMAKQVPLTDVVDQAKSALSNIQKDAAAEYRSGMAQVSKDKTVLSFDDIDNKLSSLDSVGKFKGVELTPGTAKVRTDIRKAVDDWKELDPAEYHTPEGFDALKKKIGDIKDSQQYGTTSWKIASDVYNSVRQTIAKQAPVYDKVMSGYAEAQDELSTISKELSLGNKVNPGTALRKLQSIMRDGVNTSYGYRKQIMDKLAENGAETVPTALAGQELSTLVPRGLAGKLVGGATSAAIGAPMAAHAVGLGAAAVSPYALAAIPAFSPAIAGTAAYGTGLAGRVFGRPVLGLTAAQTGRASQP